MLGLQTFLSYFGYHDFFPLTLIFSLPVLVAHFASFIKLKEHCLSNTFIDIYLGRERGCVTNLDCQVASPAGFAGGKVGNDTTAGIWTFSQKESKYISWNIKSLYRCPKNEAIKRNDNAAVFVYSSKNQEITIEVFRIDNKMIATTKNIDLVTNTLSYSWLRKSKISVITLRLFLEETLTLDPHTYGVNGYRTICGFGQCPRPTRIWN